MKFKLDENIGHRGVEMLRAAGHDVATIRGQGMGGASDVQVFNACAAEARALITLDHDFGQVLRFPPHTGHGIVILELPARPTPQALEGRIREFLAVLDTRPLGRELWIVEPGRIRVHEPE